MRAFGRNPSPTKVRHDFLRHFNIMKGRKRTHYKLHQFTRVNQEFERRGSVDKKPRKRTCTKRTAETLEQVEKMMVEENLTSLRKAAPNIFVSTFILWKILRYDVKAKFYGVTSVQPFTDVHKKRDESSANGSLLKKRT